MARFLFAGLVSLFLFTGCSGKSNPTAEEESADPIYWTECGYEIGDHACDFNLLDQNGNYWRLYDHFGEFLVLDFSTEWCGYCHLAAEETQEVQDQKREIANFWYVTILLEDMSGNSPPSEQAVERRCSHYQITAPVLFGSREMLQGDSEGWPITGFPTFYILDDELVIREIVRGYSAESLDQAIDSVLNPS